MVGEVGARFFQEFFGQGQGIAEPAVFDGIARCRSCLAIKTSSAFGSALALNPVVYDWYPTHPNRARVANKPNKTARRISSPATDPAAGPQGSISNIQSHWNECQSQR